MLFFDEGDEPDLDVAQNNPEVSEIYLPGQYERVHLNPMKSAGPRKFVFSIRVAEDPSERTGSLRVVDASGLMVQGFPIAGLPPNGNLYVLLTLFVNDLPDPFTVQRELPYEIVTAVGPCSPPALLAALDAEDYEQAARLAYPLGVL